MTGEPWTDDRIALALRANEAGIAAPESERCFQADQFWHLVRAELGEMLTAEMLDHAAACPRCLLALRLARSLAPAPTERSARTARTFFPFALLGPGPALAYLLLLVLSFPIYRLLNERKPAPQPTVPAQAAPKVEAPRSTAVAEGLRGLRLLRLTGDLSLRGGAKPELAAVALGPGEALALKLFPDLEDLPTDPTATLTVHVLEEGREVTTARRHVGNLETDESFLLLLDPALLRMGRTYRVELRMESPTPRIVLAQDFRVDAR